MDNATTSLPPALWWAALLAAAALYMVFAAAVGARLVLGKVAAARLTDERGLPEPLDPGSRSWSALLLARSLSISAAVLVAVLGPAGEHAFTAGVITALAVALFGRVAEAVIAPRWPEEILHASAPLVRIVSLLFGPFLAPLARNYEALQTRRRQAIAEDEDDDEAREEQLEEYIRDAEEGGILEEEAAELLRDGAVRVRIEDGMLPIGSLDCAGYASKAAPDWSGMRETAKTSATA